MSLTFNQGRISSMGSEIVFLKLLDTQLDYHGNKRVERRISELNDKIILLTERKTK